MSERGWRERLFGARDRLGWWLLPMFVAVGLAGAVLAGSLAVVFSSQRVDRLTRETASARADLATAADDVRDAADEALASIQEEVDAVRDQLSAELPLADAAEVGVVRLEAEVPVLDEGTGQRVAERRRANGFLVAATGDEAFVVTTFGLLVDPERPEVPLDVAVVVRAAAGDTSGRVHSWRADRDLLLLRVPLTGFEPLPWRPADEPTVPGDRVVAVGLTPGLGAVRIGGTVAAADATGVVTDLPALDLLAGGPVLDGRGRVIGVASSRYTPFSADPVVVPIRSLCDELLARCPD
ncbi:MAG: serine protease [Nitriliruptor sp.]|uniref:serine protease n=1 Tax=Nitriliruptor sp. TaxID=2448056 RepID=UPI0034A00EC3